MHHLVATIIVLSTIVAVTSAVLILQAEIESQTEVQLKREAMHNAKHPIATAPAIVVLNEHAIDTCNGTHHPP